MDINRLIKINFSHLFHSTTATRTQLSDYLGISKEMVGKWIRLDEKYSRYYPQPKYWHKLSEFMDMDYEDFVRIINKK